MLHALLNIVRLPPSLIRLPPTTGGGPPAGFSWTTHNGERVYQDGLPVFDDGKDFYVRAA